MTSPHRLFAWNFSYFSAKVRAYLSYKQFNGALSYEEVLASQDLIRDLLIPATGSNVVPQVQCPDGSWVQDSSEIIDVIEAANPLAPVVPSTAKQKVASYLIELLADEWMLPWGFWERWHYSQEGNSPNQEAFNAFQWGRIFSPTGTGSERMAAGRFVLHEVMKINDPEQAAVGPFVGMPQLGITKRTEQAWTDSMKRILAILENHFDGYDYILGGQPSLADFALIGPLYPHLYKDPVPGFMMRTEFPMVCEWIDRVNGSTEAGCGSYQEPKYSLVDGELVLQTPKRLLVDDEIPESLLPLLQVFFDEMWPMLKTNLEVVKRFIENSDSKDLPGKSFHSSDVFRKDQSGDGPLTLTFEIGGITERRMASPYQVWMLQRFSSVLEAMDQSETSALGAWLVQFSGGNEVLKLASLIGDCKINKQFEKLTIA